MIYNRYYPNISEKPKKRHKKFEKSRQKAVLAFQTGGVIIAPLFIARLKGVFPGYLSGRFIKVYAPKTSNFNSIFCSENRIIRYISTLNSQKIRSKIND